MKQPYEDIVGYSRDEDDLLSLEEKALPRRAMMMTLVRHLNRATLVGSPAPIAERISQRIRSPQIGDLVAESTRATERDPDAQVKGFGILLARRQEWACSDEEWEAELRESAPDLPDPRPTDEAWYVLYGPQEEDICRWVNCSFLTIPIDPRAFATPIGVPDSEGGITLRREDLLGALSDSGFSFKK